MDDNYIFSVIFIFIVKTGFSSILFICSAYIKDLANTLKNKKKECVKEKNINKYNDNVIISGDCQQDQKLLQLNQKENKKHVQKHKSISDYFYNHISLLFLPLSLSFLLQNISLYILSYVGTTSDVMKQKEYLIFALVQTLACISSLLPLIF